MRTNMNNVNEFDMNRTNMNNVNEVNEDVEDGKLSWKEINLLKEKIDTYMKKIDEFSKRSLEHRTELVNSIKEEKRLCNDDCKRELKEHIELCKNKHKCDEICKQHKRCFTCDKDYVAYNCRFEENGRCSHYYNIKSCEERLEDYQYVEEGYRDSYEEYQAEYEQQLAIKEDRYEEYKEKLYDYFV